ncbi:MAG: isocitrate/isopropylmalate dehydrogenase family protein [Kofleriaceae bacterium]
MSLIEGDGIGPEIASATVRAVEAAGGKVTWERVAAGAAAVASHGDPLPNETIESMKKNLVALKGPLATPSGGGYRSVNVTLRQQFDMYANVRPVRTIPGVPSRYTGVDLVIVRENTEDLYAGVEHYIDPRRTAAESIAIITKFGSERCIRYAFEYARKNGRKKVTLVHKANILKMSNGLFLDCGKEIAKTYPDIQFDDMIVDATAMKLVLAPERFDVIVTMNLFGDILSDLTAGLVGGLGVAPAANISEGGCAMFEAVHGTAPDIAGKGIANPTGLMLSAAMMLDHLDQREAGERLRKGIYAALANAETRTGDLQGTTNTAGYTDAVIRLMK